MRFGFFFEFCFLPQLINLQLLASSGFRCLTCRVTELKYLTSFSLLPCFTFNSYLCFSLFDFDRKVPFFNQFKLTPHMDGNRDCYPLFVNIMYMISNLSTLNSFSQLPMTMQVSSFCSALIPSHSLHRRIGSYGSNGDPPTLPCVTYNHLSNSQSFCKVSSSSSSPVTATICSNSSSIFGVFFSQRSSSRRTRRVFSISAAFERFTERAIKVIILSQKEAKALGRDMLFTQHLLLGLIAEEEELHSSPHGFLGSGVTIDKARFAVRSIWRENGLFENSASTYNAIHSINIPFSISTKRVLEAALQYSRSKGHNFLAPEHIALGLFSADDCSAFRVLDRLGVKVNQLTAAAVSRLEAELLKDGRELSKSSHGKSLSPKAADRRSSLKPKEKSALENFCVDLTARASEGLLDPVIGRETEVERIVQILCRRTKNNPILLGESGVGKTAIVEGLANSIAQGNMPDYLASKRVMSLDIGLLMAGAKERGELEARVAKLISSILNSGNIVLFIDKVHIIVESGSVERGNKGSGLDIADLIKPSLGRGLLQCIASTTADEYRIHFQKDKALARRFQPVWINEPNQNDAVKILLGLREKYEAHHKCRYTLEAINAAVQLSARYISNRYLPDKAIDLIDEAGSRACMEACKRRREKQIGILSKPPDEYWHEIKAVQAMQEVVLSSKLKNDAASCMGDICEPKSDAILPTSDYEIVVGVNDIAAVASLWSGIPVQQLTADDRSLLLGLDTQLRKQVVGQEEAVSAISRAVKRSRVGLKDPKRSIAVLLFCGTTGVGKTQLTKVLAACYFGSEKAMLRFDMSEYMEQHSLSKLIGSPPGYVGYGKGGTLTEAIRRCPFAVILFDEIEKAHPAIFNILLQLFEEGQLTDSQGRRVSFKDALIVMTSNVGSTAIVEGRNNSFRFFVQDNETTSYLGMKETIIEELKAYFRPELLNRIDEIVVFQPLRKTQMCEIFDIMLQEVKERMTTSGIDLVVSDSIKSFICEQGYDKVYGARSLRRAITTVIEDLLSKALLAGQCAPGDMITIDLDDFGNPFVMNKSNRRIHLSDKTSNF